MPEQKNRLERIHSVLNNAANIGRSNPNTRVVEVWAQVFSIPIPKGESVVQFEKSVFNYLIKLDDELCKVVDQLKSQNSEALNNELAEHISQLRGGLSPTLLRAPWQSAQGFFAPEHITAIKFARFAITNDGTLTSDEIVELREKSEALRDALEDSTLPDGVKSRLLYILKEIQAAIEMINIFGIDEVEAATNELLGLISASLPIRSALGKQHSESGSGTLSVWEKIQDYLITSYVRFSQTVGGIQKIEYVAKKGEDIIPILDKIIS